MGALSVCMLKAGHMSTLSYPDILSKIRRKVGREFEDLCTEVLRLQYPDLEPRRSRKSDTTAPGTPDAIARLGDSSNFIAFQWGGGAKWKPKLFGSKNDIGDAEKVANLVSEGSLHAVALLVFCTTAEIDIVERRASEDKIWRTYGLRCRIYDSAYLAQVVCDNPGIAVRRLGCSWPIKEFETLDHYLDSSSAGLRSRRDDAEQGALFLPSDYATGITTQLEQHSRFLLYGRSGAGKTSCALAFAIEWCHKHPGAIGYYRALNSELHAHAVDGILDEILRNDRDNELFILDNCQLASRSVAELCGGLERNPPKHCKMLFISAQCYVLPAECADPDSFDEYFVKDVNTLAVHPEHLFLGIIEQYLPKLGTDQSPLQPYQRPNLNDGNEVEELTKLCGHNLYVTRIILEEWNLKGGRLTDVSRTEVLQHMSKKFRQYLRTGIGDAMSAVLALWQYEIPVGTLFLDSLAVSQVMNLEGDRILEALETDSEDGRLYQVVMHPSTASLLFATYLWERHGADYDSRFMTESVEIIARYLRTKPPNSEQVFRHLSRYRADELIQLLINHPVMGETIDWLDSRDDLSGLVGLLSHIGSRKAHQRSHVVRAALTTFTRDRVRAALNRLEGWPLVRLMRQLASLDIDLARTSFADIDPNLVAGLVNGSYGSFDAFISNSRCIAIGEVFSDDWKKRFLHAIDLQAITRTLEKKNLQKIMWVLRNTDAVDSESAGHVIKELTPDVVAARVTTTNPLTVLALTSFISRTRKNPKLVTALSDRLLSSDLEQRFETSSGQSVLWSCRELKSTQPALVRRVLRVLGPCLASAARSGALGNIDCVRRYLGMISKRERLDWLSTMNREDLASLLDKSSIKHVTSFFEELGAPCERAHKGFPSSYLCSRLDSISLTELLSVLSTIDRNPYQLAGLTRSVYWPVVGDRSCRELLDSDLASIASGMLLLWDANPAEAGRLAEELRTSPDFASRLQRANMADIGKLVFSCRDRKTELLESVYTHLQSMTARDWQRRLSDVSALDLAKFLWSVLLAYGFEAAQEMGRTIAPHVNERTLGSDAPSGLSRLLWHMAQLNTGKRSLRKISNILTARLSREQSTKRDDWLMFAGVMAVAGVRYHPRLPDIDMDETDVFRVLEQSRRERRPYKLALSIIGYSDLNRRTARDVLSRESGAVKPLRMFNDLLESALEFAKTPLAEGVLVKAIHLCSAMKRVPSVEYQEQRLSKRG